MQFLFPHRPYVGRFFTHMCRYHLRSYVQHFISLTRKKKRGEENSGREKRRGWGRYENRLGNKRRDQKSTSKKRRALKRRGQKKIEDKSREENKRAKTQQKIPEKKRTGEMQ